MTRNAESYRTTDQSQYPAEQSPELNDWQKKQAAEHFLENLHTQDQQLAQELQQVTQDPAYRPSWLNANQHQAERCYDSLRLAMAPLQHDEREYITTETLSIISGTIPEKADSYARQPASNLLHGEDPPEYRVSFDPDGYNSMMAHLQRDLEHRSTSAQQSLHDGLAKPDRYDFTSAIDQIKGLDQALTALENGEPIGAYRFHDRRNQNNYHSAQESRSNLLMEEYTKSIQSDFPELAPPGKNPTPIALLTEPDLQEKFTWFVQGYELLQRDAHDLAHAIHQKAVTDTAPQTPNERAKLSLELRQFRDQLLPVTPPHNTGQTRQNTLRPDTNQL